ncbi:B-type lectin plumieribetin-like [Neoarius graeffei]|uniref:B-type lectin plumieribetin-like n=1 Tax=Neoarius graeffei TaxID=443677 RepID=UPI00298C15D4|nr:B-type lectin plumieribetin-like [Neoarius graeffei]
MSRNFLSINEELQKGDFLLSNNSEYKAIFQDDGNFVVYGWALLWATDTGGIPGISRLAMQNDCNLVIYTPDKPVWAASSYSPDLTTCRLTLGNDGILVIHRDKHMVWKSTKKN